MNHFEMKNGALFAEDVAIADIACWKLGCAISA